MTDLNGPQNGFKLDGENRGDYPANYSVSRFINAADDVNSDGYADLIIGVGGYPVGGNKGRSYIVSGRPGVWVARG